MTTTAPERAKHPETVANLAAGERFAESTKDHVLTIKHDDGAYKHLLVKQPNASWYWYEIITWPGNLTISGDMGTWTFRRDTDMLAFFRTKHPHGHDYRINAGYWAEKLQGGVANGRDSAQEYDPKVLADHLRDRVTERATDRGWPEAVRQEALAALETDLIKDFTDYRESESADTTAAYEYDWAVTRKVVTNAEWLDTEDPEHEDVEFKVSFDWDTIYDCGPYRSYNPHFLWCLHAIVHAIDLYDEATKPAESLWPQDDVIAADKPGA